MIKLRRLVTVTASLSALVLSCSSNGDDSSGNQGGSTAQGGSAPANGGSTQSANGGSGTGGATGQGGSGTGGSGMGGASNGGSSGSNSAGMNSAGSNNGGSNAGGSNNGGAAGKGNNGGNGGKGQAETGGAGGKGNSGSGGGSSGTATFAQVASLLGMKCAGSMCHGNGSQQVDLVTMNGLYMRLTTALPSSSAHCGGTTLVMANDAANSFLAKVVQARSSCSKGGGMEQIARMPDNCSTTSSNPRACLSAAEIKTITDWIAAGAPQ